MASLLRVSPFKIALGWALAILVAQEAISKILGPFFSYYDELLISGLLAYSLMLSAKRILRIDLYVYFAFLVLLFLSAIFGQAPLGKSSVQLFIHFKFFFLFLALCRIYAGEGGRALLQDLLDLMLWITLIGFAVNVLLQDRFFEIFDTTVQSRGGLVRVLGFPLKPNDLALFLGVYLINYISRPDVVKRLLFKFSVVGFFSLLILMNGSRVGLAAVIVGLFLISDKRTRLGVAVGVSVLSVVVVAIFGEYMEYVFEETANNLGELAAIDSSQYIRGIMIYYGFVLAGQYFPIGSGAATFGSVLSEDSSVYSDLHLMSMRFFQDMEGVYDSNLATVMGEFGFLGLLLFIFLWCYLARFAYLRYKERPFALRYVWAVSIFAAFVFVTNPLFMYQYNGVIFVVALLAGPRIERLRGWRNVLLPSI